MNLHFSKSRAHYRPILISIWGNHPDPFTDMRERMYQKMIKTPVEIALFAGDGLYNAYNESIQYCLDNKLRYFILVYQGMQPHGDWSNEFRLDKYAKHSFIVEPNLKFIWINVRRAKIYGFFKNKTNNIKTLYQWMTQKAISEGHAVRELNGDELKLIGDVGDEPEPKSKSKRQWKKSDSKQGGKDQQEITGESEEGTIEY